MKIYFYFKELLKHKYFVFQVGIKIKVPIIQLVIHDWRKFLPSELFRHTEYFYIHGGIKSLSEIYEFEYAWDSHKIHGKHHWQEWVLRDANGNISLLKMPNKFAKEMIADWACTFMASSGINVFEWYNSKKYTILLHSETRTYVEYLLQYHKNIINTRQ